MPPRTARLVLTCAVSLLSLAAAQPGLSPAVTAQKKTIQATYQGINDLAARGQLTVQRRTCPNLGPEFILMTDRAGKIRRYAVSHGGEDSAFTVQHDYDPAGRLSFVLVTLGTVHGAGAEWRYYFAPSGRVIDTVRSGSTTLLSEPFLWTYITRDPRLDWTARWCP